MACTCSVFEGLATITTKVGRLSLSEPKPYDVHAPKQGRPVIWLPVSIMLMAGSWLMASVFMLRMKTMSSTVFLVQGKSSVTHMPHSPARSNLNFEGAMGKRAWPEVMVVSRWPIRTDSGRSLSYHFCMTGL